MTSTTRQTPAVTAASASTRAFEAKGPLPAAALAALAAVAALGTSLAAQTDPLFLTLAQKPGQSVGVVIGVGEFTGDERPDIVLPQYGQLRVLPGNGDGSFALTPLISIAGLPLQGLAIGDLNGDGRDDLVTGGGPKVNVVLASGPASFLPSVPYTVTDDVNELRLADLDGDGVLDIVASNDVGPRVSYLLGVGDGTFLPHVDFGPTGARPNSVATGDLDGDGDVDLVFGNYFDDFVSVFLNGSFANFGLPLSTLTSDNPQAVALGDLDGDLLPDLVVSGSGDVQVFHGNGNGTFELALTSDVGATNPGLELADFDEDGHLDIAVTSGFATITILRGHGDLTFDEPAISGGGASPYEIALADLNRDGELDIAMVDFAFDGLTVLLGHGDTTFGPHLHTGTLPSSVILVDLDLDGVLDAVTSNKDGNTLSVALGRGNGVFDAATSVPAGIAPGHLASGDFDADGVPDVVLHGTGFGGGVVTLFPGKGDGSFDTPYTLNVFNDLQDITVADFDADGRLDAATADGGFGHVALLKGRGNGSFLPPVIVPTGDGCSAVTSADFDGDGLPDLAVCSSLPGSLVQVHRNLGNGVFAAGVALHTGPYPLELGLTAGDLDADGDPDLVACGLFGNMVGVFRNQGGFVFAPVALYPAEQNPNDIAIGDVDNDGDADVVIAQRYVFESEGRLGVLLNDGTGQFAPQVQFTLMAHVSDVALGDMDGDGVLDVAAAVSGADTLSILVSRRGPWDDVQHPLAGGNGYPHQTGEGTLVGGQPFKFALSDALPGAAAYHIVGLAAINAPFKGGVLVPSLTLINGPLPIDGNGRLVLQEPWPAGVPSGVQLWLQFWFKDAGGPAGFAASNALRATMP